VSAPELLYLTDPECHIVIFDLAEPDGGAALYRYLDALAEYTTIKVLDKDHCAVIVRPGWASRPAT
jgi:hypothetical protein